jgi:PAS domain S-box-containing protein
MAIGMHSSDQQRSADARSSGWKALDAEAYKALFFHSVDGVLFTDPTSGAILAANPAACRLLGMTEAELCLLGREGIMDPADRSRWEKRVDERARTGSFRGELSFRRADGSTFSAGVTSQMFADAAWTMRSCLIIRDISDRSH